MKRSISRQAIQRPGNGSGAEAKAVGGSRRVLPYAPCAYLSICLESCFREEYEDKRFRHTNL